jgi:hypothetical protein
MKVWQAGLLVVGAALAGGLAVKMTELPPVAEVTADAPVPAVPLNYVAPASPPPAPRVAPATPSPAPPPDIAAAPPPVYSEPLHVYNKPSPAPRPVPVPAPEKKVAPPEPGEALVPQVESPPVPYQEPPHREPAPPSETKPAPEPSRRAVLELGSGVTIRFLQPLSADRVRSGDIFQGVLADPLVANGFVVGERGAPVTGRVVDVQRGGITLRLLNFRSADGQRVEVSTEPWSVKSVAESTIVRFRLAARITVTERRL